MSLLMQLAKSQAVDHTVARRINASALTAVLLPAGCMSSCALTPVKPSFTTCSLHVISSYVNYSLTLCNKGRLTYVK